MSKSTIKCLESRDRTETGQRQDRDRTETGLIKPGQENTAIKVPVDSSGMLFEVQIQQQQQARFSLTLNFVVYSLKILHYFIIFSTHL
jgi:hypothetical protein